MGAIRGHVILFVSLTLYHHLLSCDIVAKRRPIANACLKYICSIIPSLVKEDFSYCKLLSSLLTSFIPNSTTSRFLIHLKCKNGSLYPRNEPQYRSIYV